MQMRTPSTGPMRRARIDQIIQSALSVDGVLGTCLNVSGRAQTPRKRQCPCRSAARPSFELLLSGTRAASRSSSLRERIPTSSMRCAGGRTTNGGAAAGTKRRRCWLGGGGWSPCLLAAARPVPRSALPPHGGRRCGGRLPACVCVMFPVCCSTTAIDYAGLTIRGPGMQDGETALIAAAQGGHSKCVSILLQMGADTSVKNKARDPVGSAFCTLRLWHRCGCGAIYGHEVFPFTRSGRKRR